MSTAKRKWSEAQKLAIIQEAEQNGITETMRKLGPCPLIIPKVAQGLQR